ncbi:MAG: NCS2 family permease [Gemmatimonadota bacterium]
MPEHETTVRREVVAGITTFLTMAYIIVVNPKILEAAGIPLGPSMVATILTAAFGTLLMGVYARRPFAIASYMGENAFVAFTVVGLLGYPWVVKVRSWLANAIPESMKLAFAVGIGLFLSFIGLHTSGIVVLGASGAPVHVGDFGDPKVLLGVFGFLVTAALMIRRVTGAILLGILATIGLAFALGIESPPGAWVGLPPSLAPTFLALDVPGVLTWGFFPIVLTLFVMAFVDTIGTLMGLALTELVPAFATIALMSFTYNLGIGMTAGFLTYAVVKTVSGRWGEVSPGMWILAALSALFYVFYPY